MKGKRRKGKWQTIREGKTNGGERGRERERKGEKVHKRKGANEGHG